MSNKLTSRIIRAAINVQKVLGSGLSESVYQACLIIELEEMTIKPEQEILLPIMYLDRKVHDEGSRMDLLVEDTVIVSSNVLYTLFEVPLHRKVV